MLYSRIFGKTVRETPKGALPAAQRLLVRAGMVRAAGPGIFVFLPLGRRVLHKIAAIAEEEFSRRGVQFLEAPAGCPARPQGQAPADECRRALAAQRRRIVEHYFLAAHHDDDLCLLAGALPMSYRELPLMLGFRRWRHEEEGRGPAAFTAARRFLMQAAYSFDADDEGARASCALLHEACLAAFRRMEVEAVALRAPARAPGAPPSEEFAAFSEAGDEEMVECDACSYRASRERAQSVSAAPDSNEEPRPLEAVYGPGIVDTARLAAFVGIPWEKTTKTLLFEADDRVVAVCVRGDCEVSSAKLAEVLGCGRLRLAPPDTVRELTGADVGYAGPVGLPQEVTVLWDLTTDGRVNFEAGANRTDYHYINVNFDRDLPWPERFVDVRLARQGELCAACRRGRLLVRRSLKLGHVTQLGTVPCAELKALFTSKTGRSEPASISIGGLELMRLMAAIVEQHSDAKGIAWPASVAPCTAVLISLPGVEGRARELYESMIRAGIEILWDDRETAAGAKFADADLIGAPIRLVLSPRTGGQLEWKTRRTEGTELLPPEEAVRRLAAGAGSPQQPHPTGC